MPSLGLVLQSHLQRQQREIQEVLAPLPPNPSDTSKATTLQPAGSAQFPPHVLLCDVRAAERSQQRKPLWPTDPESPDGLPNKDFVQPRWQSLSPEVLLQRRQQQLLRQKMLDFSRGVRAAKPGLPGQIEEQPVSNKGEQRYGYGKANRAALTPLYLHCSTRAVHSESQSQKQDPSPGATQVLPSCYTG